MRGMWAGAFLLCGAWGWSGAPPLRPREGFIPVSGGSVWYKVVGQGKGVPLLFVHGGPGGQSCWFQPTAHLLGRDRPVIVYDQLGGGRSGRPQDPSYISLERFVLELDQVRKALGLKRVHLLGHSCGATLVAEYLATRPRKGIVSVTFCSPLISTPLWMEDAARLRAQLPPEAQETLRRHEAAGTTSHPDYKAAEQVFNGMFVFDASSEPPSACIESHSNEVVYRTLWGPAEFHATGPLKFFDRTATLPTLRMPVLYLCGRRDEVLPETLARLKALTPGAAMHVFEKSRHGSFLEEKEPFVEVVGAFLAAAEARKR